MKIEKISEKQIKCTLNRSDLQSHQIKISELATGTENAKELFNDMMAEAFDKFGFDAEDIPLMIEAIPVSADCIVLLITKVDNPEDIDRKFSRFSSSSEDTPTDKDDDIFEGINNLFPLMDEFPGKDSAADTPSRIDNRSKASSLPSLAIYDFVSLDHVLKACKALSALCISNSSLYKANDEGLYYLVLHFSEEDKRYFPAVHHTVIEFGRECSNALSIDAYLHEHCETLIHDQAIEKLTAV